MRHFFLDFRLTIWPSLTNITIWQLLIFLTVICGRFEDMDLPCRNAPVMHQSWHPSCSHWTKAFHVLLFFFLSRCSLLFSCSFSSVCLPNFLRLSCTNFVYLYFSTPSFSLALFPLSVLLLYLNLSCSISFVPLPPYFSLSLALYLLFVLHHFFCPSCFFLICLTQPVDPSYFLIILASFVQICFYFLKISVSLLHFQSVSVLAFCLSHSLSVYLSHSHAIFLTLYLSVCLI